MSDVLTLHGLGCSVEIRCSGDAAASLLTGVSLVCVAPGGTGKTTRSRRLGQSYGYLTDETVATDADGRILPHPEPLSVRRQEQPGVEEIEVKSLAEALESQVGAPGDRSTLEGGEAAVAMMVRHGILTRS
mgnify:FL=1